MEKPAYIILERSPNSLCHTLSDSLFPTISYTLYPTLYEEVKKFLMLENQEVQNVEAEQSHESEALNLSHCAIC